MEEDREDEQCGFQDEHDSEFWSRNIKCDVKERNVLFFAWHITTSSSGKHVYTIYSPIYTIEQVKFLLIRAFELRNL